MPDPDDLPRPDLAPPPDRAPLIDVGCNLLDRSFAEDRAATLRRARDAGVVGLVAIASDLEESRALVSSSVLEDGSLSVRPTVGIHPHRAASAPADFVEQMRALVTSNGETVAAIGECGLDYNRDYSPRPDQRRVFAAQVALACELRLPLYVHDREAHDDTAAILADAGDRRPPTLIHCFTGTRAALERWVDAGYSIGITGWICDERRGGELQDLVASIPVDQLMLETDAPYLLPRTIRPRPRSRRNEPGLLPWVLVETASRMGLDAAELAVATSANARRLFAFDG